MIALWTSRPADILAAHQTYNLPGSERISPSDSDPFFLRPASLVISAAEPLGRCLHIIY